MKSLLFDKLRWHINKCLLFMSRILTLKDFEWILTCEKKQNGYYSLKKCRLEISIDNDICNGWTVYLSNKWQEVLEEHQVLSIEEAIKEATRLFNKLPDLEIFYKKMI